MILARRHNDVCIIALNRPEKRNALIPAMFDDLRAAILGASRDRARAILLGGEGGIFCGGFDLQLCARDEEVLPALLRGLFETISLLRSLPVPVVIGAQGAAIAGGCALLGGADIVVTDRSAKLGYPVTPLGISPAVSAPTLRLSVGDGRCRARLLEPTLVSGEDALRFGLVHELVEAPEAVLPRALELAERLASKPAVAMEATRSWLLEVETALGHVDPHRGLEASLALAGSEEERQRLEELFS